VSARGQVAPNTFAIVATTATPPTGDEDPELHGVEPAPSHVSPADPSATLCRAVYLAEYDAWPWGTAGGRRAAALAELPLEALSDPGTILEHLDRIAEATDRDRVLAISGAKALIEATTRLTLHELGEPVDERTDPPTLIKQA
jgi:hypothetical protein